MSHPVFDIVQQKQTITAVKNDERVNILKQYEVNTKLVTLKSPNLLLHVNYGQRNIQLLGWRSARETEEQHFLLLY